jgi:hypothetical protein
MAKQWKCARCSAKNPESTLTCGTCRMIRGAVVVPGGYSSLPILPTYHEPAASQGTEPSGLAATEWAAHANERPRLLRPVPFTGLILALFVVAVGVTIWFTADRSPTGEISGAGNLGVWDLRIGDCFDLKTSAAEFTDVTARPCSETHQYELYWIGSMDEGAYPSDDAFEAFFDDHCISTFDRYVGEAWEESPLDIYWTVPNLIGWTAGNRSVQCAVYDPREPALTYSLKEGRRPPVDPENEPLPL